MSEGHYKTASVGVDVEQPVEDNIEGPSNNHIVEGDLVTRDEERDLARGLHQRHISLIAIAGAIVCDHCDPA